VVQYCEYGEYVGWILRLLSGLRSMLYVDDSLWQLRNFFRPGLCIIL
jgi:hypothetical protein